MCGCLEIIGMHSGGPRVEVGWGDNTASEPRLDLALFLLIAVAMVGLFLTFTQFGRLLYTIPP